MAIRNHEEIWSFDLNYTSPAEANLTLTAKSLFNKLCTGWLPAAGWTCVRSCLGSSSGNLVVTGIPWAVYTDINIGVYGTWVVFKSPTGIVKGLDGSGLGDQSCIWLLMYIGGESNLSISIARTAFTGGSYSTRPTSTTETLSAKNIGFLTDAGLATWAINKASFIYKADGSFVFRNSQPSTGNYTIGMDIISLKDVTYINSLSIYHPFAIFIRGLNGGSTSCDAVSNIYVASTHNNTPVGWDLSGNTCKNTICCESTASGVIGFGEGNSGNGLNGEASMSWMWLSTTIGPNIGQIGRIPDLTLSGAVLSQGAVDDATNPKWCVSGNLLLPVNAGLNF